MPYEGVDFNEVANKDALLFPDAIPDPDGRPSMALIHRPLFPGTGPDEKLHCRFPRVMDILRESIWISYHSLVDEVCDKHHHLCHFDSHRRLACPAAAWEQLKVGGGTPPMLTPHGWLFLYHGVCEALNKLSGCELSYSAGLLVLDEKLPHQIRYRSPEHFMEIFRTFYGPLHNAFLTLDAACQTALAKDLLATIARFDTAKDGSMRVPSAYAEIVVTTR